MSKAAKEAEIKMQKIQFPSDLGISEEQKQLLTNVSQLKDGEVKINVNGQIVKEIIKPIFNQNTYKINNLPQGFYFLQITAEKGNLTKKIIVN